MTCDEFVIPLAIPFRRIASIEKSVRGNVQLGALPKSPGIRPAALQIYGVRACRGDPFAQRLRRAADIQGAELEVRIAHERVMIGVHPAIGFVIRVEKRALRRRLYDKPTRSPLVRRLVRQSLCDGGSLGEGGFPINHIPVMPQREPRRDLVRHNGC